LTSWSPVAVGDGVEPEAAAAFWGSKAGDGWAVVEGVVGVGGRRVLLLVWVVVWGKVVVVVVVAPSARVVVEEGRGGGIEVELADEVSSAPS
jgi:hypothetical protein